MKLFLSTVFVQIALYFHLPRGHKVCLYDFEQVKCSISFSLFVVDGQVLVTFSDDKLKANCISACSQRLEDFISGFVQLFFRSMKLSIPFRMEIFSSFESIANTPRVQADSIQRRLSFILCVARFSLTRPRQNGFTF